MTSEHIGLHVIAREDRDFHSAVRLTASIGFVRVDRLEFATAHPHDTIRLEARS